MKFRDVYSFLAIDEVKDGKTVFVLDKEMRTVAVVNDMKVGEAVSLIQSTDNFPGRFEFWVEEEEEVEVNA